MPGLTTIRGDFAQPAFGLSARDYDELAAATDAIVHTGADLDMFADYGALEPTNVGGTRAVLKLALAARARCVHVSSSAALPLGAGRFDESSHGLARAAELAPRLVHSDGYSRTKLAAEALAWRAAERGLDVTVARLPHLVGPGLRSRLADTLALLAGARAVPEPDWAWQLAPVDSVCARLEALLEPGSHPRLVHLTCRPLPAAAVADALRARVPGTRVLSLPATVTALARVEPTGDHGARLLVSVDRLIREHGPRAALSLSDPELVTSTPLAADAKALLVARLEELGETPL